MLRLFYLSGLAWTLAACAPVVAGENLAPLDVLRDKSAYLGRIVTIEGYLEQRCQRAGQGGICLDRLEQRSYVIFGSMDRTTPKPKVIPVPTDGTSSILIMGHNTVGFDRFVRRKVIATGRLRAEPVTLFFTARESGIQLIETFESVLSDVEIRSAVN